MSEDTTDIQQTVIAEISGENLMEYTSNIAKEVRLSGSAEELRAFHYVQKQLDEFGLETKLIYQDAYISLPIQADVKIDGKSLPCITHSMAPSTGENGIVGNIVYAGDISESNIDSFAIYGNIVLVDGIALPSIVQLLENFGAIGVIFINGPLTHEMVVSTVWGNPTPDSVYPTIPVISVNEDTGTILKTNFNKECRILTKVDTGWRKIPVLTADIKGATEPDKFLLFSGHIDSWHYGAMDNASANATMLEVARILSKHQCNLRRGIRLAFWSGHSHGRYAGSTLYCDTNWEELHEKCFLHIYVDSVGGKGANVLSESNCMAETKDLASRVIETQIGESFIGKRFARAGDQSFWGAGVPSLFMGMSEQPLSNDPASKALFRLFGGQKAGGFGWWWHTTEDTIDKIDEANLVRDCKIYTSAIFDASTSPFVPIDHRQAIKELKDVVVKYQEQVGQRFDLSLTIKRLECLNESIELFYKKIGSSLKVDERVINAGIMKLSRILIPLNYVEGDQFNHDLAVYQPPLPLLGKVTELAEVEYECDHYFKLKTFLTRQRNKVNNQLLEANKIVLVLIENLKKK